MEIKTYELKAIVDRKLSDFWRRQAREVFDRNAAKLVQELKRVSPVGATGELRDGWQAKPARKLGGVGQYSVDITNRAPNSFYRIVGRGPGRMPPKQPILDWVYAKGIRGKEAERRAFLIRRKIGEKGTERWMERDNPVGMRRDGSFSPKSPIISIQKQIQAELRRLKL